MDFDIMKGKKKEGEPERQATFAVPSVDPALMDALGVKTVKRDLNYIDEETADKCRQLIIGATQLMVKRSMGLTDFDISDKQYKQWQDDVQAISREVMAGTKSYDDLHSFIEQSINMPGE